MHVAAAYLFTVRRPDLYDAAPERQRAIGSAMLQALPQSTKADRVFPREIKEAGKYLWSLHRLLVRIASLCDQRRQREAELQDVLRTPLNDPSTNNEHGD